MEVQHSETDVQGDTKKRWGLLGTPTSIYLIRFIYYIYNYRLLYYLPMERMKDFKAEVDRLVWEYIVELEEENKKLKSDLAFERTMLDNVRAEYKSLQNVNKKLKEELSKLKEKYWDIDY